MVENTRNEIMNLVEKFFNEEVAPKKSDGVPCSGKVFDATEIKNLVESALDCWWTEGRFAEEFISKLKDFLGVSEVTLVNSGSSANLVAMASLTSHFIPENRRVMKGDEVITVATGFPTTIYPIIQVGAVPVFVDIVLPTYNIDVSQLEAALTEKTKAIFIAHTLGNPFDIKTVKEFCVKNNLWLIEDSCDALGSEYGGDKIGTIGDLATLSFYPAHQITLGEGGAVLTNNPLLAKAVRSFRDWGRDCWCATGQDNTCGARFNQQHGDLPFGYDHKFVHSHIGYNLKLTDMQAAIGVAQIDKLQSFIETRKTNYSKLRKIFKRWDKYFILPEAQDNSDPCWFGFPLTIKKDAGFSRVELLKYLDKEKIGTRLLFAGNIIRQPAFKFAKPEYRVVGELTNSDIVTESTFWIGVYPGINDEKISRIEKVFTNFLAKEPDKFNIL